MDIALTAQTNMDNPVEGDIDLINGQVYLVDSKEAIAQHLRIRLRFFLGEWFLNQLEGVPYFRDVLIKNPDMDSVRAMFQRIIKDTPGVESIERFDMALDPVTRILSIGFRAKLSTGGTLEFGNFIVEEGAV